MWKGFHSHTKRVSLWVPRVSSFSFTLGQPKNIRFPQVNPLTGFFCPFTITIRLYWFINLGDKRIHQCTYLGQMHSGVPSSRLPNEKEFEKVFFFYFLGDCEKGSIRNSPCNCPFIKKWKMKTYVFVKPYNSTKPTLGLMVKKNKTVICLSNKNYPAVSQSCNLQLHLFGGILWINLSPVQHEAIVLSNILHGLGKVRFYWANRREVFQDFK